MNFRDYFERNVVQYFDCIISESVKAILLVHDILGPNVEHLIMLRRTVV